MWECPTALCTVMFYSNVLLLYWSNQDIAEVCWRSNLTCIVTETLQAGVLRNICYFIMKHHPPCPCTIQTPETARYESVTKSDFLAPSTSVPSNNHRTLTFCTPVVDTGGSIEVSDRQTETEQTWCLMFSALQAPLGLSCSSRLLYRAGEGAPESTAGPLAHCLPTSWTGPAGVELGVDTSYKQQPVIHQVGRYHNYTLTSHINHTLSSSYFMSNILLNKVEPPLSSHVKSCHHWVRYSPLLSYCPRMTGGGSWCSWLCLFAGSVQSRTWLPPGNALCWQQAGSQDGVWWDQRQIQPGGQGQGQCVSHQTIHSLGTQRSSASARQDVRQHGWDQSHHFWYETGQKRMDQHLCSIPAKTK